NLRKKISTEYTKRTEIENFTGRNSENSLPDLFGSDPAYPRAPVETPNSRNSYPQCSPCTLWSEFPRAKLQEGGYGFVVRHRIASLGGQAGRPGPESRAHRANHTRR